jgi:hypothetical protein
VQSTDTDSSLNRISTRAPRSPGARLVLAAALACGCEQSPLSLIDQADTELRGQSAPATALPATAAIAWVDLMMKIVGDEKLGAPEAARLYAITSVALYESTVDGMPGFSSLGRRLNGLPKLEHAPPGLHLDWPTVLAKATGRVTTELLTARPAAVAAIASLADQQLAARAAGCYDRKVYAKSVEHGERLAVDLIAWARSDGFLANRDLPYSAPQGPDLWVPTGGAPATTRPAEPYFGKTRPLAMATPASCSPGAPPPYSEDTGSARYAQAQAVVNASHTLTPEQDTIARYWADGAGTPATPGHWMSIARQMVADASLARAVQVLVTVGVTQLDAFISCWDTKYAYNHLRPETYIRRVIDPAWQPLIPTPQHPEHTSGHACSAGAGSVVLTALFGPGAFDDVTHVGRGLGARHFDSFSAAASEAAVSRLYTGHHFPSGSEAGLASGRCVGQTFLDQLPLRAKGGQWAAADGT